MAEGGSRKKKKKHGGLYCVAGGSNNISCKTNSYTEGISLHIFPKDPSVRKKWISFVKVHRTDFVEPTDYSALCSLHFEKDCYNQRFTFEELGNQSSKIKRTLHRNAIPTIQLEKSELTKQTERTVTTPRERRYVSGYL